MYMLHETPQNFGDMKKIIADQNKGLKLRRKKKLISSFKDDIIGNGG